MWVLALGLAGLLGGSVGADGASRSRVVGVHDGRMKVQLAAPPVDGAANEALCAYLAERFGLPKSAVSMLAGLSSRRKRVLLKGVAGRRVSEVFGCSL